jgi:elongation factor 1-alpha
LRIGGGVGSVVMGRVASGVVRAGVLVSFAHCGLTSSIKALEVLLRTHDTRHDTAIALLQGLTPSDAQMISGGTLEHVEGDHTGFSLTTQPTTLIARGDVCGDTHSDPPRPCVSFTARLALLGREGLEIRPGDTVRLRCHSAVVECRVARLVAQVSRRTGAYTEAAPARLRGADVADVELEPLEPLCVEAFADYGHALGRFVVEVADQVAAVGLVKTVTKEEEEYEEEGEEGEEDSA